MNQSLYNGGFSVLRNCQTLHLAGENVRWQNLSRINAGKNHRLWTIVLACALNRLNSNSPIEVQ